MKHHKIFEKADSLSLKWKLIVYFLLFSAIMLVVLWFFQIVFLDKFYEAIKTSQVKKIVTTVSEHIGNKDLATEVANVCANNDVRISIYNVTDSSQPSLYMMSSNQSRTGVMQPSDDQSSQSTRSFWSVMGIPSQEQVEAMAELAHENGNSYFASNYSGVYAKMGQIIGNDIAGQIADGNQQGDHQAQRMLGVQLVSSSGTTYMISVDATVSPITSTEQTLRIQLGIITIILILLTLIISFYVAKRLSKPITKINESAKELSKGNYDVVFDGKGYEEIAELNTTLNYMTRELSKVEGLRRELIANISHDLRTPLTMITGYAEVMRDVPGEKSDENIQTIIDEAKRLTTLVSDLMNISKLESGVLTITPKKYNLSASIRSIFERVSRLVERDNLNLILEVESDVFVFADEVKMSQVIYNLINNAINYSGDDKTIIVRQTVKGKKVRIDVIDHGIGIERDKLPLIWDRYYKADKTHKRAKIGTGLGLSIVKKILELHKAEYGVLSEFGKGSDFWFMIDTVEPKNNLKEVI
ncbi:MAG: HAMP domain-containing sensor histidine kinase [Bacillota bacterium]|nr:HAMP domain-containing sensor histidine kinase [Bacillota bacterium]